MKTRIIALLFVVSIVTACQSSALEFHEADDLPDQVQEKADSKNELQSIEDKEGTYIIFRAKGDVKPDVETKGNTVSIDFNVSNASEEDIKQNNYYLTLDEVHDTIDVSINGKPTYFDESITSLV